MNLNGSSERTGKRRLQFSIRTLLILATIVGPILGWYGPAAVDKLLDFYADEPAAVQVPTLRMQQLQAQPFNLRVATLRMQQLQAQLNLSRQKLTALQSGKAALPSKTEGIELGMRADQWERELQRVE
jgi:hypothetical protein